MDDLKIFMETLDENMKMNWSWGIDLGSVVNYFIDDQENKTTIKLNEIREHLVENLAVICDTSYTIYKQGFCFIIMWVVFYFFCHEY